MKKTSSSFTYFVRGEFPNNYIAIIDQNVGMSVTNDIENVVAAIAAKETINPDRFLIIYRDSEGMWDGWNSSKNDWVMLQCYTEEEAIAKYRKNIDLGKSFDKFKSML